MYMTPGHARNTEGYEDERPRVRDQGLVHEQQQQQQQQQRKRPRRRSLPHEDHPAKPAAASSPRATEEDVRRASIPTGYSYKRWDPAEEPIFLLGSVFDVNSLGKWIYDWTVFHCGLATPLAEMAGELWLLLIQLTGKEGRRDHA
ncbi:hypothetical protein AA0117_g13228 [Alternaria alternata]|uniref:Uncharacterized protein n=1 Tax=Alternaria alternata TaxID=5599 RepID=A0A4Q4MPG9_ALTAL|nr:hypothetical protein AA0117_g13228 [Alternaria alternata]